MMHAGLRDGAAVLAGLELTSKQLVRRRMGDF